MGKIIMIGSLVVVEICVFLAFGCGGNGNAKITNSEGDQKEILSTSSFESFPILKLERKHGQCFGKCPVYSLEIYGDGTVIFDGEKNVKALGRRSSSIPRSQVHEIVSKFDDSGFLDFSEHYIRGENCSEIVLSDGTFAEVSFRHDDRLKTVLHYDGCQGTPFFDTLFSLEKSIDDVANSEQWVK